MVAGTAFVALALVATAMAQDLAPAASPEAVTLEMQQQAQVAKFTLVGQNLTSDGDTLPNPPAWPCVNTDSGYSVPANMSTDLLTLLADDMFFWAFNTTNLQNASGCSIAQYRGAAYNVSSFCQQLEANGDANFALGVDVYFTCALSESDLLTQTHFPGQALLNWSAAAQKANEAQFVSNVWATQPLEQISTNLTAFELQQNASNNAFAKQVEQIVSNLAYESNVNSYKVQAILFNNTQWQNDSLPAPRPAAPLSTDALTTVVSTIVNNIISSLNNGASFGNETTTATAPAPAAADDEAGNEALGFGNNAANSPLAAALSGQTNQIIISAPGLTTTS
eukprot:jgi/Astpho2/360/fgenesh1_pg.00010_%23_93_t